MTAQPTLISRFRQRLAGLSTYKRIAIGNAFIISVGAVLGTVITIYLIQRQISLWAILGLILIGIGISLAVTSWVAHKALQPLYQLRTRLGQAKFGINGYENVNIDFNGSEIDQLAVSIDALIIELNQTNRQLKALSQHAINAQEDERKRIARSLHDDTGQALTMLIINLERIEDQIAPEALDLKAKISDTRKLAARTLDDLRKIVYGLRPAILDDLGLIPAIRWYARSNLEAAGIQFNLDVPEDTLQLPTMLTTTLFRITQEAVNNIVRHSQASTASISLRQDQKEIYLQVEDNGLGFEHQQGPGEAIQLEQWGLLGIQERVALVGGEFNIASQPGKGTILQITVPLMTSGERSHG